jgi:paraquat-inducible protein A
MHEVPQLEPGKKAYCARCSGLLAKATRDPVDGLLALTVSALVLLLLANIFPFLHFSLEGQTQENRIITGVIGLWVAGQGGLAALILFTTVLAPALRILGLLYVILPLELSIVPPGVSQALRFQEGLVSWAMLDVYMLALLVALVKLTQMADVQIELGVAFFVALFVMLTLMGAAYDRMGLWDRVEKLQEKKMQ